MSRSNPDNRLESPCKRHFEWNSDTHQFKYYDKTLIDPKTNKNGVNVFVNLPFTFIVLDQLTTVKGFNKKEFGIWANEVRNTKLEPLTIRVKSGIVATGLYSEKLLNEIKGAKYSKSVYIAYYDKNVNADGTPVANEPAQKLFIGNIQFNGASVGPWIDLNKQYKKLEEESIAISAWTFKEDKTGDTDYSMPVFKAVTVSKKANTEATALDAILQAYLKDYFKNGAAEEAKEDVTAEPEKKVSSMPENSFVPKPNVDNSQLAAAIDGFENPAADPFAAAAAGVVEDDLPF